MSFICRKNQNGSMPTFVIVGVILTVSLIGGIFFLKNRSEQIRQDKIATSVEQQTNKTKVTKDSPKDSTATDTNNSSSTDSLPETGAGLDVVRMLEIGLLAMSITGYLASRQNPLGRL